MNYYNEHDPKAAAWLRELIKEGHIPPGEVDTRSILDVRPHEIARFTQQHFFAGIGGWSLALRLAGWPDDRPVRTGSCPCQPFSQAGKGLGTADERHLWPVFRDIITFGDPTVTFGEQVASKAGRAWLDGIRADLEGLGYEVGAADLCAAGINAPHPRQRLYWLADPASCGRIGRRAGQAGDGRGPTRIKPERLRAAGGMGDANSARPQQGQLAAETAGHGSSAFADGGACWLEHPNGAAGERFGFQRVPMESQQEAGRSDDANPWANFDLIGCADGKARRIESGTFPLAHGVSGRVGLLRGYGNAIVPQVAAEFIQAFLEI